MVCWHPDYILGDYQFTNGNGRGAVKTRFPERDDFTSLQALGRYLSLALCSPLVLPLSIYDHSGVTMYVGHQDAMFDPGGWDTSYVGFIYADIASIIECCGTDRQFFETEFLDKALRSEVEEYASWLRGEVYGYSVEDPDGNELDSCWGFIGFECVKEEAEMAGKAYSAEDVQDSVKEKRKEAAVTAAELAGGKFVVS